MFLICPECNSKKVKFEKHYYYCEKCGLLLQTSNLPDYVNGLKVEYPSDESQRLAKKYRKKKQEKEYKEYMAKKEMLDFKYSHDCFKLVKTEFGIKAVRTF